MRYLVVTLDSALAYWSSPYAQMPHEYLSPKESNRALLSTHSSITTSLFDEVASNSMLSVFPAPVDLLVSDDLDHRRTRSFTLRSMASELPPGSLVALESVRHRLDEDDVKVLSVSPEFCFLQLAARLPFYEAAELACELCGSYSINPHRRKGLDSRRPITTPARLSAFIQGAAKLYGHAKAASAVRYVNKNSKSPKESQISLLMTLTRRRVGTHIPSPRLNDVITLDGAPARLVDNGKISPDFWWKDAKVIMEYDSRDFHDTESISEHDIRKRNIYSMLGMKVITMTKGQLHDFTACRAILDDLSRQLCAKQRPPSPEILRAQQKLHRELLFAPRRPRQALLNARDF